MCACVKQVRHSMECLGTLLAAACKQQAMAACVGVLTLKDYKRNGWVQCAAQVEGGKSRFTRSAANVVMMRAHSSAALHICIWLDVLFKNAFPAQNGRW